MKKRNYSKPILRTVQLTTEKFMIPISGHTTPEAADSKASVFDGFIRDGYNSWK